MIATANPALLTPDEATDHITGPVSATVSLIEYGELNARSVVRRTRRLRLRPR